MSFIQRMSEAVANELFKNGNNGPVAYIMLTNREPIKPLSKEIDDNGGYAKEPFTYSLAQWMEKFIKEEKARHEAERSALDAIGELP